MTGANALSEPMLVIPLSKECFLFSPDANLEVTDVISTEMHAVWKIGKSAAIAACGVVAALAGCACRDMATTASLRRRGCYWRWRHAHALFFSLLKIEERRHRAAAASCILTQ